MQGTIWANICCVVLMDKLGKIGYDNPSFLYKYKGEVLIPPLEMVDDVLVIQKCDSSSRRINSVVNSFMECEKLTLSDTKCHKIHMGRPNQSCPTLKVHEQEMLEVACDKYLGDKVHKSATNKSNIEDRTAKGFGIVNHILAIVKEVPLGWRRVKAGLILRQAMLINGILFNTEAWHGIKKTDIESFEKLDESLLRGLVKGHSKGPLAALYGELGQIPVKFIWASRSIMFLQTILKRDTNELTNKVFRAQENNPINGDFCVIVEEFKEDLQLNLTNEEIKHLSKN